MRKWGYVIIVTIFIAALLLGCNAQDESNQDRDANEDKVNAEVVDDKRTNFGKSFIENGNYIAYLKPRNELYIYNHETEDEFLVHENVEQFDFVEDYVLYLASDGITSELDIELQAIYRTHLHSEETKKMAEPMEEDDAFTSPRAFHVNDEGSIVIEEQVGFFYSNFWYNYYATDVDFRFEKPIIEMENEYDSVINELKWQGSEIFLLVDRVVRSEDEALRIELHSFSVEDGPQLLQENALPLSIDEYSELFELTVYIAVDASVLFISAIDDSDVEKITYKINLDTHEIIHKTP